MKTNPVGLFILGGITLLMLVYSFRVNAQPRYEACILIDDAGDQVNGFVMMDNDRILLSDHKPTSLYESRSNTTTYFMNDSIFFLSKDRKTAIVRNEFCDFRYLPLMIVFVRVAYEIGIQL